MLKYNLIMDQNSNMGGFSPMPEQQGVPPMMGAENSMQGINNQAAMNMAGEALAMPQQQMMMPAPGMPGAQQAPMVPSNLPGQQAAMAYPEKKNSTLIETIILVVVCLIAAAAIVFAVINFMNYNEVKNNADSDKQIAVAEAKKEQQEIDNVKFEDQLKLPNNHFTGPSDYGSLGFEYPKTWSVYIESDGLNNSDFVSYFSPTQVNPVKSDDSRYALRFSILNRQFDAVVKDYEKLVENNELRESTFNGDGQRISGIRYEGMLDDEINGVAIVVKVNDKTAIFQTDASVFFNDFDAVMASLRRNS